MTSLACSGCIPSQPGQPDDAVVVGALLPFSGDLASSGINLERPLLMVGESVNQQGGIRGQAISMLAEDAHMSTGPNFNLGLGMSAFKRLVEESHARALIGPKATDLARRLTGETSSNSIVYLPGSIGSKRSAEGCVFDMLPYASVLVKALVRQLTNDGIQNIGIFYVNDEYGELLNNVLQSEFALKGGQIRQAAAIDRGQTDFSIKTKQVLDKSPQALILLTYPLGAAGVIQEVLADSRSSSLKWYLAPTLREPEFLALIPPGTLDGAVGVGPGIEPDAQAFADTFAGRWDGDSPRIEAFYYYDMASVLILAMMSAAKEKDGLPDYQSICSSIRKVSNGPGEAVRWNELDRAAALIAAGNPIEYQGLSGPVAFDSFGNLTQGNVEMWKIENNALKTVVTYSLDQL